MHKQAQSPDFGAWANFYAAKGLRVHPLAPGTKDKPLPHWPEVATSDPGQVARWWNERPTANIALATGLQSGDWHIVDIETDCKPGQPNGEEELAKWCADNGVVLPQTWEFKSGSGGIHRLFAAKSEMPTGAGVLPSVDYRGKGGYAVMPPSRHPNGQFYSWLPGCQPDQIQIASIPFALFDLITSRQRTVGAPMEYPEEIPEGERNERLFKIACSQRAIGLGKEELLAVMDAINDARCCPPVDYEELEAICERACTYKPGDRLNRLCAAELDTYRPEDYTDVGTMTRFVEYAKDTALFVKSIDWHVWDGTRWAPGEQKALLLAIGFTDKMQEEATRRLFDARAKLTAAESGRDLTAKAKAESETKKAQEYLKFALKMRSQQRLNAFLTLSKAHLTKELEALDADPFILNTPVGMVNLRTGGIAPHDPGVLCSKITRFSPGDATPEGKELWRVFLNDICCGDTALMEFLQMVAGMVAVGKVLMENLIIAHGGGRNGKSTFFNTLAAVLGDYAGAINPEVLTTGKQNSGADLAELKGKRLIIAPELEEGKRLSSSILKRIASTDPVVAERKYRDPESFIPSHTAVVYTNYLPRLNSTDEGTKRRLVVLPFNARITKEVKNYADTLLDKAGGAVLDWVIDGANKFCAARFTLSPPPAVQEATNKYFEGQDWLNLFLEECCTTGPTGQVKSSELHTHYMEWARGNGDYARSRNDFAAEMKKRGFESKHTKAGNVWLGISLRAYGGTAYLDFKETTA